MTPPGTLLLHSCQNAVLRPRLLAKAWFCHHFPFRIRPDFFPTSPSKNSRQVDACFWMQCIHCLHWVTLLNQCKGELLDCVLHLQALPIGRPHRHQRPINMVCIRHCHVDQPKNNFWRPIMRPTIPPHVVRSLGAVPLVDEVECLAILFCLHRT